jgi:hypothetical protein
MRAARVERRKPPGGNRGSELRQHFQRNGGQRKHENEHDRNLKLPPGSARVIDADKTGMGLVVEVVRDRHAATSHSAAQLGRLEIFWISFHAAPPHGHIPSPSAAGENSSSPAASLSWRLQTETS